MERLIQEQYLNLCEYSSHSSPFGTDFSCSKAFKHVFTSPSSVNKAPTATRSGNARIHGMTSVTPASISYIATQVRHACYLYYTELIAPGRFDSPLAPHPSFAKRTRLLTPNDSTTAYWSALKTLTSNNKSGSSWHGGIGETTVCWMLAELSFADAQAHLPQLFLRTTRSRQQ
jgi:hypothetical protein